MKALALLEAPDHVCGRYRVSAFAPALAASGWSLAVEGVASNPIARIRQLRRASQFDAVILQRKLLPGWQLAILRARTRRLIFDFDDAILYRDSYDSRGPLSQRRISRFAGSVRSADLVLAGNGFLAKCATEHGARSDRVRVVPTCIDTTSYPPKPEDAPDDGRVRLVWIGSSSTFKGLEQRRSLLERLGREVPNLVLRVIADRFPTFEWLPVEPIAWSNASEAADLSGADIGISMVPDDLWTRGKCGLKTLQYGASGLPSIVDPVGVHPEIIEPGRNGFLPRSDDEWFECVRALAEDRDVRRRMGREARQMVEANTSVDAWSSRFVSAVTGRDPAPAPMGRARGQAVPR